MRQSHWYAFFTRTSREYIAYATFIHYTHIHTTHTQNCLYSLEHTTRSCFMQIFSFARVSHHLFASEVVFAIPTARRAVSLHHHCDSLRPSEYTYIPHVYIRRDTIIRIYHISLMSRISEIYALVHSTHSNITIRRPTHILIFTIYAYTLTPASAWVKCIYMRMAYIWHTYTHTIHMQ